MNPQNVAGRLTIMAAHRPEALAVVEPLGYGPDGRRRYRHVTFRGLDQDSDRIARGLQAMDVTPGTRLALLVRPGIDFFGLVFGLLKARAVAIFVDPGMGLRGLLAALAQARPEGFIAGGLVQAVRAALRRRFPQSRFHVTLGRRWFWGGLTLDQLRGGPWTAPGRPRPRPTIRRPSSSPAAARARPRACSIATGILRPRWTNSASSTACGRARSISPAFPCSA